MKQALPRILFAAPSSGSGKTLVTCGFLRLCQRRLMDVQAMKCGPDYIDPMFHKHVLGIDGVNLDSFFLNQDELLQHFTDHASGSDLSVIEGVMGYYDGVAGISTQGSTYEVAAITRTPVILIVDGKKGSLSLAAVIKGFLDFRSDAGICGVILNRTSAAMAERLRPHIEALGIHLAGWIPDCGELRIKSRHLGLVMPGEQADLQRQIDRMADQMAKGLDLEWIFATAAAAPILEVSPEPEIARAVPPFILAVASDEAFSFYYQENLRILEEAGAKLQLFSPLHDKCLPEGTAAILLGGGYPELYAGELADNKEMLAAVRSAAESGVKILAECGGFLYLHETLEGADGNTYPLTGVIRGHGFRTDKLSRFGYLTLRGDNGEIKGHEFHYWDSDHCGQSCMAVKPLSDRSWKCMHRTKTMLAGFPHLYYPSNPMMIRRFLAGEDDGR